MIDCLTYLFGDDGTIPNNSGLPLLVYKNALTDEQLQPEKCKVLLNSNGWSNAWVNGIYSYHHYHSTTHEVLAVISGTADVMMGGEQGKKFNLSAGDVIIIPAGVGHCHISSSADFRVVGAYPGGKSYDLCTGKPSERPEVFENIKNVSLLDLDPVTGKKKPLWEYWKN